MLRFVLLTLTLSTGLFACRTTNMGLGGGEAPTALAEDDAQLSPDTQCEFSGGEVIEGDCYCQDGTATFDLPKNVSTCAQWMKQNHQACYAKGGIAKKNENNTKDCFCPDGRTIDENGSRTCYQQFSAKNPNCASARGIILGDDRVCKCMHNDVLASTVQASNSTCAADHKAKAERCHSRGGLNRNGRTCECPDGTFIHKDENATCADKWFFVDETVKVGGANSGGQPVNSNAVCKCQLYNNRLVLYKPNKQGEALGLYDLNEIGVRPKEINTDTCYDWFSTYQKDQNGNVSQDPPRNILNEAIQQGNKVGGCGGKWTFIPTVESGNPDSVSYNPVSPEKSCICKPYVGPWTEYYACGFRGQYRCQRNYNAELCGIFKPNGGSVFYSWSRNTGCDAEACQQRLGSETIDRYCTATNNGRPSVLFQSK